MHLKIFVFIYLFCVAYIQAQQPDSLSQQEIRKELGFHTYCNALKRNSTADQQREKYTFNY